MIGLGSKVGEWKSNVNQWVKVSCHWFGYRAVGTKARFQDVEQMNGCKETGKMKCERKEISGTS